MCGVIEMTPGALHSGWSSGSGSGSVTSSTARSRPVLTSATSASVSTTGPRAALTSTAPSRIAASSPAPIRPRVASVSGASTTTASALGQQRGQLVDAVQSSRAREATPITSAPNGASRTPAPGDRSSPSRRPAPSSRRDRRRALGPGVDARALQQPRGDAEQRRHHPLGHRRVARAARAAQRRLRRDVGLHPVGSGREHLHHRHAGERGHARGGRDRPIRAPGSRRLQIDAVVGEQDLHCPPAHGRGRPPAPARSRPRESGARGGGGSGTGPSVPEIGDP